MPTIPCRLLGLVAAALLLSCSEPSVLPPAPSAVTPPLLNKHGWTVFTPAPDSRIVYVSSSAGDDGTGRVYSADSPELNGDPRRPNSQIDAFRTFREAYKKTREGYPDWVLLKSGDTFNESLAVRSGRSQQEPFLLGSYGAKATQPLVKIGNQRGVRICCESFNDIAIQGLDFYAQKRDPDSPAFESFEGKSGLSVFVKAGHSGRNLLIEGNKFRFVTGNSIQAEGTLTDVVFRRNLVANAYSTTGHSQGLYGRNIAIVLEDNIFDHNGWYQKQKKSVGNKTGGQATMFNHNTYFTDTYDVVMRNNIFLRPASIGSKWTAESGQASTRNIIINNNLYIDGEIGISIGGNKDGPYRFKNIQITDNVLVDIGRSQPTDRDFAWYLWVKDWDTGSITGNTLIHPGSTSTSNIVGMRLEGSNRAVRFTGNKLYGFGNGYGVLVKEKAALQNISLTHNDFVMQPGAREFVRFKGRFHGVQLAHNNYFSAGETEFSLSGRTVDHPGWNRRTTDQSDKMPDNRMNWALLDEPYALVNAYQLWLEQQGRAPASLAGDTAFERFVNGLHQQSYSDWNSAYSAAEINKWIRDTLDRAAD